MNEEAVSEWTWEGRSLESVSDADLDACVAEWLSDEAQADYARQQRRAHQLLTHEGMGVPFVDPSDD